jgi:hypothetical protein
LKKIAGWDYWNSATWKKGGQFSHEKCPFWTGETTLIQILHGERSKHFLSSDIKHVVLYWMNHRLCGHSKQSLIWWFV